MDKCKCPYCGKERGVSAEDLKDLNEVGKAVLDCENCDKWFLVRDDGDGEYVCGTDF